MVFIRDVLVPALLTGPLPDGKQCIWGGAHPSRLPKLSDDEWRKLLGEEAYRRVIGPEGDRGLSARNLRRCVKLRHSMPPLACCPIHALFVCVFRQLGYYRDPGLRMAALAGATIAELEALRHPPAIPGPKGVRVDRLTSRPYVKELLKVRQAVRPAGWGTLIGLNRVGWCVAAGVPRP